MLASLIAATIAIAGFGLTHHMWNVKREKDASLGDEGIFYYTIAFL